MVEFSVFLLQTGLGCIRFWQESKKQKAVTAYKQKPRWEIGKPFKGFLHTEDLAPLGSWQK